MRRFAIVLTNALLHAKNLVPKRHFSSLPPLSDTLLSIVRERERINKRPTSPEWQKDIEGYREIIPNKMTYTDAVTFMRRLQDATASRALYVICKDWMDQGTPQHIKWISQLFLFCKTKLGLIFEYNFYHWILDDLTDAAYKLRSAKGSEESHGHLKQISATIDDILGAGFYPEQQQLSHFLATTLIAHFKHRDSGCSLRVSKAIAAIPSHNWKRPMLEHAFAAYARDFDPKSYGRMLDLWNELERIGFFPSPFMFKCAMLMAVRYRDSETVDRVFSSFRLAAPKFDEMAAQIGRFEENWRKCKSLVYCYALYFYANTLGSDKFDALCAELRGSHVIDAFMYEFMIKRALIDRNFDRIMELYNEMKSKTFAWTPSAAATMIRAFRVMRQNQLIPPFVADMSSRGVVLEERAYAVILRAFGDSPEEIEDLVEMIKSSNVPVTEKLYIDILKALAATKKTAETLNFADKLLNSEIPGITPSIKLFNAVLVVKIRLGLFAEAVQMEQDLERYGLEPNKSTELWLSKANYKMKRKDVFAQHWKRLVTRYDPVPWISRNSPIFGGIKIDPCAPRQEEKQSIQD